MATKTATFSADGTIDLGQMVNPIFTVSGATWGSGSLVLKIDGVAIRAADTADFVGILADTGGRAMHFSATLSGSSGPDIDLQIVYSQSQGRAVI